LFAFCRTSTVRIFTIDNNCSPRCPYAARCHGSNHIYMVYNQSKQQATLRCHHPECAKRISSGEVEQFQWPVYLPATALAAAVDAAQPATMHSRQHLVRWAEDYDDGEPAPPLANDSDDEEDAPRTPSGGMRPFPAAPRLMVIRANMGIGEAGS
jgi:hypothetical protein